MDRTKDNDWQKVRTVFEEALLQPKERRREHARELCGGDSILWDEVLSLLKSYESADSFLETPAVEHVIKRDRGSNQLFPGQQISHYEITRLIGEGGMGEVYLARDKRLHRNVAIKLLRGDLLPHVRGSERLLREARAVALLEHPNICHIYEISESDGLSFIVMQYVVGTTLDEILASGMLDAATAMDLAAQIADGLAEAHSQGIVHRDIKPANIVISNKGQAKILDFGLAKAIENEKAAEALSRLESTGGIMGTIPYMSPEQLSGKAVDARTDVFSFGVLLFEMVSGSPAFRRERNEDTISAILNEEPDWSALPPAFRPMLERCLAKNKAGRYSSAGELTAAISGVKNFGAYENPARYSVAPQNFSDVVTEQADPKTLSLYPWPSEDEGNLVTSEADPAPPSKSRRRGWLAIAGTALILMAFPFAAFVWQRVSLSVPTNNPSGKLYWELSYTKKRDFIRNRVMQIQTLIGDDQRRISNESLNGISAEVDWYVKRRDSLSQEPFKDGLRSVYGRASQYVAMVAAEFEKEGVPTSIGIYQAIVESEYRDCLVNENGPTGIFQFTKATAEKFGLAASERCRVDLSAKAAAAYEAQLRRDLGGEGASWTLTILSFNQGQEATRRQLEKLVELGSTERNYWAITENRQYFADYNPGSDPYLRRFFAAAIIGENPEMFGLVTPPLSTIRSPSDLGIPALSPLITVQGGTFSMGRNDTAHDFEKPTHPVSVETFRMGRTEVTNSEFADFIVSTGYTPNPKDNFLAHWVNGRPLDTDEDAPVRFVNFADISAYLSWRSKVDGVQYRLPTEEQWEYAARNGSRNTLYPWGEEFDANCAFINQARNEPVAVGTKSCPNIWGIHDLIGNVFEWTASPARPYAGSPIELVPQDEEQFIIRGGGAFDKSAGPHAITSTFRYPVPGSRRSAGLGFRLVAPL